jgi:hypothetical protein
MDNKDDFQFPIPDSLAVPPVYKQTEIGVIPEDWDDPQLEEIAKDDSPICYGIVQVGPPISISGFIASQISPSA